MGTLLEGVLTLCLTMLSHSKENSSVLYKPQAGASVSRLHGNKVIGGTVALNYFQQTSNASETRLRSGGTLFLASTI